MNRVERIPAFRLGKLTHLGNVFHSKIGENALIFEVFPKPVWCQLEIKKFGSRERSTAYNAMATRRLLSLSGWR